MATLSGRSDHGAMMQGPLPLIRRLRGQDASLQTYKYWALFMTFIAYTSYHASRKPFSIVKSVLDDEDSNVPRLNISHVSVYPSLRANYPIPKQSSPSMLTGLEGSSSESTNQTSGDSRSAFLNGWAPFNTKGGKGLLGDVDLAFLASYAIGMYFAGHLADRLDLRLFLTAGMMGSGFFVCLFGFGYWLNIHSIYYYLIVQLLGGVLQATGWPSVVSIVSKWFGRSQRGLIMGIWNAHTSVGNILGSLIAAGVVQYGWGWSFLLPGLLQASVGLLMFFFLVVEPSDVGLHLTEDEEVFPERENGKAEHAESSEKSDVAIPTSAILEASDSDDVKSRASDRSGTANATDEESGLLHSPSDEGQFMPSYSAVGFLEAWNIPGVAPFAFCLFFSKLVAYTFLNWLPFYIAQSKIAGEILDEKTAGDLSTLFDVGGVVGGILAGHLSDRMNARAITAAGFMYASIPALFLYRAYGTVSMSVNIALMMMAGMLVNGPYSLITTAVSADLGTHSSLRGNPRALATVTAIIDGTGSVGAAIGPLLTGYISEVSWDLVFVFLMVAALIAGLLLTRLVIAEVMHKMHNAQPRFLKEISRPDEGGEL